MLAACSPFPLDLCALGLSLPEERLDATRLLEQEAETYAAQLAVLSSPLRQRLMGGLGIDCVATMVGTSSRHHAELAARTALERAEISPKALGLIVDCSTLAADTPSVWSLSHHLQGTLGASSALALATGGSGCAGLHLGLLVTEGLMRGNPGLDYALLVAADRAPDGGRCCLPISLMADAASAIVVARAERPKRRLGRIHGVLIEQYGKLSDVLYAERSPLRLSVDGAAFERQVLPSHFVLLSRLLTRLGRRLGLDTTTVGSYVYPNTTALDRKSACRSFGITEEQLVGPGPRRLGHAFASDLLINAEPLLSAPATTRSHLCAWLAAGSGFTWGAALVESGA